MHKTIFDITEEQAIEFMKKNEDIMFPCSTDSRARKAVEKWLMNKKISGKPGGLLNYIDGPKKQRLAIKHYVIIILLDKLFLR